VCPFDLRCILECAVSVECRSVVGHNMNGIDRKSVDFRTLEAPEFARYRNSEKHLSPRKYLFFNFLNQFLMYCFENFCTYSLVRTGSNSVQNFWKFFEPRTGPTDQEPGPDWTGPNFRSGSVGSGSSRQFRTELR
jgi:hypothetical protein